MVSDRFEVASLVRYGFPNANPGGFGEVIGHKRLADSYLDEALEVSDDMEVIASLDWRSRRKKPRIFWLGWP